MHLTTAMLQQMLLAATALRSGQKRERKWKEARNIFIVFALSLCVQELALSQQKRLNENLIHLEKG